MKHCMVSLQQLSFLLTLTWLPGLTAICHLNLRLCLVDSKAERSCLVLCSLTSQDDHYYYYSKAGQSPLSGGR